MMVYRAALIGCGKIGSEFADDPRVQGIYSHAGAYAACPGTKLVAVCDTDPIRLGQCGDRWGVAARYQDAKLLLAEQHPDVVSICTHDHSHYDLVRAAISTGARAVLAEKPLAQTLEHANELVRLAKERGVVLVVNYSRRYADNHVKLRSLIKAGSIGPVGTVSGYYTKGLLHNGTHWFDLARFLVGEVAWVWGFATGKDESDDSPLDAFLQFDCGASAHLMACDTKAFSIFEMDLIGTRGRARVIESGHTIEIYQVVDSPYYTGYRTLALYDHIEGGMQDALLHAVEDMIRCLETGDQPTCSVADGAAALKIAIAVRESARSGQRIAMYDR